MRRLPFFLLLISVALSGCDSTNTAKTDDLPSATTQSSDDRVDELPQDAVEAQNRNHQPGTSLELAQSPDDEQSAEAGAPCTLSEDPNCTELDNDDEDGHEATIEQPDDNNEGTQDGLDALDPEARPRASLRISPNGPLAHHSDFAQITRVFRRYENRLRQCYEQEIQRFPDLAGQFVASWQVDSDGDATDVEISENTLNNRVVESCVQRSIQRIQFPDDLELPLTSVEFILAFEMVWEQDF